MSAEQTPLLSSRGTKDVPSSPLAGLGLPLNIGHRGYKAAFPENSMAGFRAAVAAGADAVETDLHLSRDGVVVLSHDATLKRCFGIDKRVADCDWDELKVLRTIREPHQPLARLDELLAWLAEPEQENVGLLLDVKRDDDPDLLLCTTARTIESVEHSDEGRPWSFRILIGAWTITHIEASRVHLPDFQIFYTGASLILAHRLLHEKYDGIVNFSLLQPILVGPIGARFLRLARERRRYVFVWTVNEVAWMKWAIRKELEGVITDHVGRFADVRDGDRGSAQSNGASDTPAPTSGANAVGNLKARIGYHGGGLRYNMKLYTKVVLWQLFALLLTALLWRRLTGQGGKRKHQGKAVVPGKA